MEPRNLILEFLCKSEVADRFATPDGLHSWLVDRGLMEEDEPVTERDVIEARHLRAALCALLATNNGGAIDDGSRETLRAATERAPLHVAVDDEGGLALESSAGGVSGALAQLVALVYAAGAEGTLSRLKVCRQCGWAYYDRTKNRSRVWCDMATCGSREKARAYRARKRQAKD